MNPRIRNILILFMLFWVFSFQHAHAVVTNSVTPQGSGASLPSQTGNAGKFLGTNGSSSSWLTVKPSVANGGTNATTFEGARANIAFAVNPHAQNSLGDSITFHFNSTSAATGYAQLLATDIGATLTNEGISGDLACDVADLQAFVNDNPGETNAPLYTMMIYTNDANTKGVGAYETVARNCHQAVMTWLTIPSNYKVFANASGCVKTGTWSADTAYQPGGTPIPMSSTTHGDTMVCTVTTYGGPIYIWNRLHDSDGGTMSYAVSSGGPSGTITTATTPAIATQNGGTHGVGLTRLTSIAAGTYTVTFTVTSATNASNVAEPIAVGTPSPYPYRGAPRLFSAGVPWQQNDANSAITAQYDADAKADVTLLANDGLPVYFVPIRNYLNATTDMSDSLHPNDTGHSHLRDAWEAYIQFYNSLSVPITQGPAAASSVANYVNANNTNAQSITQLNPGFLVYSNQSSGFSFGMDLGYEPVVAGTYVTRVFAPSSMGVSLATHTQSSGKPTAQSDFTDNLIATPGRVYIPGVLGVGTTATPSNYSGIFGLSSNALGGVYIQNSNTGNGAAAGFHIENNTGAPGSATLQVLGGNFSVASSQGWSEFSASKGWHFITDGNASTGGTDGVHFWLGGYGNADTMFLAAGNPGWAAINTTTQANSSALTVNGTISASGNVVPDTPGTGLSASAHTWNSSAVYQVSYQPGLITSVTNTKSVFSKVTKASTVDNLIGSASAFSCVSNPTITMYECGTDASCATSPTTIGTVTITAAGQAFTGTVSAGAITANDFIGFAISAGTCTSLDISATAQVHSN